MDYNMMPPPSGGRIYNNSAAVGTSYPMQMQFYSVSGATNSSENVDLPSSPHHYKPHFSGRAHLNRPPPLSLQHSFHQHYGSETSTHSPHFSEQALSPRSGNGSHASPHVNSPHTAVMHLQQGLYSEPNHSPHHTIQPHYSRDSPRHFNDPSPHHFNALSPSPHRFNDPGPSPRHFNDPNPSPHHSTYSESPHPGTPYSTSHPGTPAYAESPHHASPHPNRSSYQHFFAPNVPLPVEKQPQELMQRYIPPSSESISQLQNTNAMLHSDNGCQGDAMLSAINMNQGEQDMLQDTSLSAEVPSGERDWTGQPRMKTSSSASSLPNYTLFDGSSGDVDEILSEATDLLAHGGHLSLSSANENAGQPDASKLMKPRPKGRPSKNVLSPRPYGAQCPACGKTFNNSSALAKHKLTHSDERKYICQLCSKAFKRQDHLNGHMMTHRAKKPFECTFEGCTKSYCDARSLRRHLENHHNVPADVMYNLPVNYGLNGNNQGSYNVGYRHHVTGTSSDTTTPSPHGSPSYSSGAQYFHFDSSGQAAPPTAYQPDQQGYLYNRNLSPTYAQQVSPASPQHMSSSPGINHHLPWGGGGNMRRLTEVPKPVECTVCGKRFKNLPALNGHMRLHGGYVNVKKPDIKSDSNTSDSNAASDSSLCASQSQSQDNHNVMATSAHPPSLTRSSFSDTTQARQAPATHHAENSDQGNVRQDGDRVLPKQSTLSSSEPYPCNLSAFSFSPSDQQHLNQQLFSDIYSSAHNKQDSNKTEGQTYTGAAHMPTTGLYVQCKVEVHDEEGGLLSHCNVQQPEPILHQTLMQFGQQNPKETPSRTDAVTSHSDLGHAAYVGQRDGLAGEQEAFLAERKRHTSAPSHLTEVKVHQSSYQSSQAQFAAQSQSKWDLSQLSRRRRLSADAYSENRGSDMFAHSDGAVIFRSPPPVGAKKRKNRPEPLVIPPNVAAAQTRLRSPRIWEPPEPYHSQGHRTPPPYTPPPILSPLRSGTGLFYRICAPGTPLSSSLPTPKLLASLRQNSVRPIVDTAAAALPEKSEELAIQGAGEPQPPPTDILPHINIGPNHQANIPNFSSNRHDTYTGNSATLLWSPDVLHGTSVTDQEFAAYMDFACCAAVPGSGCNKEYALHTLHHHKGDLKRALLSLMSQTVEPSLAKVIGDYHYQESDMWSSTDIESYTDAIVKYDKDFGSIVRALEDRKTMKQCIEFYYLWKKISPEEYKRVRIERRKRRESYNLRSKSKPVESIGSDEEENDSSSSQSTDEEVEEEEPDSDGRSSVASPPTTWSCDQSGCGAVFNSKQALNGHARIHNVKVAASPLPSSRDPSPVPVRKPKPEPLTGEEYPCKLCGKVFYKVKSRSAHMKSHSLLAKKSSAT